MLHLEDWPPVVEASDHHLQLILLSMGAMFDELGSVGRYIGHPNGISCLLVPKLPKGPTDCKEKQMPWDVFEPSKRTKNFPDENECNEESGRRLLVGVTRALAFLPPACVRSNLGGHFLDCNHNETFDQNMGDHRSRCGCFYLLVCGCVFSTCCPHNGGRFRDTGKIVQINKKVEALGAPPPPTERLFLDWRIFWRR